MSSTSKKPLVDEDVDDLDDVLDDFTTVPLPPPARPTPGPSGTAPGATHGVPEPDDDFANDLAAGMEALMRELAASGVVPPPDPSTSTSTAAPGAPAEDEKARADAFAAAWEALLVEGMNGGGGEPAPPTTSTSTGAGASGAAAGNGAEDAFARTIREAMARMEAGEAEMRADASASSSDPLAAILASLSGDGSGGEGDEDLGGMLEGMMGQLMSKDVLYEPLKELHDKFPEYLTSHAELSAEDRQRYEAQQESARKIVAVFEDPGYKDEDAECAAKVVGLMNEMQTHGSPPAELMGPMPAGLEMGPDGMPKMPGDCILM